MCNLYSMTKNVDATRRLFGALNSRVGNLPSLPGIFPDYPAPIVRSASDVREIVMARWGMPSSPFTLMQSAKRRAAKLKAKGTQVSVKEILRLEPDCGVTNTRPLLAFAGIWTNWTSVRKAREGEITAELFGFLTCEPMPRLARCIPKRCRQS